MQSFDDYSMKYPSVQMRREDGILEMALHTDGGPWQWLRSSVGELEEAFLDVGRDRENEVVILTGTGNEFSGPRRPPLGEDDPLIQPKSGEPEHVTSESWDAVYSQTKQLINNLLNIEVPMISAINGPAPRHAEIPLLCDVVLASETATIQDSAHFAAGQLPGDGMHVVFPLLMGLNRSRYFLLTGQELSAMKAQEYGLINEVLPGTQLLPRAWTLAREFMRRPPLVRRYARVLLTQELKRKMHDMLGYGLALEGIPKMGQARILR